MKKFILLIIVCFGVIATSAQRRDIDYDAYETLARAKLDFYNIIYLIEDGIETNPDLTATNMRKIVHATPLHSVQEIETYEYLLQPHAIIIHPSAIDFIDKDWLQAHYLNGVIITAFNTPPDVFADMIANEAMRSRYELPDDPTFFVSVYRLGLANRTNPLVRQTVQNMHSSVSGSHLAVLSTEQYAFVGNLALNIEQIRASKLRFMRGEN